MSTVQTCHLGTSRWASTSFFKMGGVSRWVVGPIWTRPTGATPLWMRIQLVATRSPIMKSLQRNWSGAILHIKNIRWSMLSRQVTSSSGHNMVLNQGFSCLISGWTNCIGWGYFINNHRNTLDKDGEWFYESTTRRVYLTQLSAPPTGSRDPSSRRKVRPSGTAA